MENVILYLLFLWVFMFLVTGLSKDVDPVDGFGEETDG